MSSAPGSQPPPDAPQPGTRGLALSGGGYRAMVFHLGSLRRLNEAGLLKDMDRVSSVSGGSIIAATLALAWPKLKWSEAGVAENFESLVGDPIRAFASSNVDVSCILKGLFLPGSAGDYVAKRYDAQLLRHATLSQLPEKPAFIINATSAQSLSLVRFTRNRIRDWRVGQWNAPDFPLAWAVAASSAFPPVLSPLVLKMKPEWFEKLDGSTLDDPALRTTMVLTDGGVYDNLGLEQVWGRCETVFVSDGGGQMKNVPHPPRDWLRHGFQALMMGDNQVRNLRMRQVVGSLENGERKGAFWSVRTLQADYELANPIAFPVDLARSLAAEPTRLKAMSARRIADLANWGYAIADTALRRYFDPSLPTGTLPYRTP